MRAMTTLIRSSNARSATGTAASRKSAPCAKVVEKVRQTAQPARSAAARESFDHWWNDNERRALRLAGESIESMKIAMTYEATRRRPEVVSAARAQSLPPEWQHFTGLAVAWLENSWATLFPDQQQRLADSFHAPFYRPPIGMSSFPQRNRALAESIALRPMPAPAAGQEDCFAAVACQFEAAGFVLLAVDCKTRAAMAAACNAILKLAKTQRADDVRAVIVEGSRAIARGRRTVRQTEVTTAAPWRFNFYTIAEELEQWDRVRKPSTFMGRIRL